MEPTLWLAYGKSFSKATNTCYLSKEFQLFFSKIDENLGKTTKIYPLPHMFVIKDLVPVSL